MSEAGYVRVDLLNFEAFGLFMAAVGDVAERAPDTTGFETQAALWRAFEQLAADLVNP